VSSAEVLEDAVALATASKRDVVVALNYPVRRPRLGEVVPLNPRMHVEGLANFTGAIVEDEDFFVFRVFDPKGQR